MKAILLSTYDLGHQPFGLASPAAWLIDAGADIQCFDLAIQKIDQEAIIGADLIAIYLPMHTATRLAEKTILCIKQLNPEVHICCFGLYAPVNKKWLCSLGVHTIIGGEFEQPLTDLYRQLENNRAPDRDPFVISLDKQDFRRPYREGLPSLDQYAQLIWPNGRHGVVGYTEASRGCKHRCRHCPVVPVYDGQFRIIQRDVVMADIRQLVAKGAEHITFGDPDFFNGPGHALPLVHDLHREFPHLTYDVTIKIQHLLARQADLPALKETGCLFVTTAVESIDDRTLLMLDKGHTQSDLHAAVDICREIRLPLSPTFIPFTPWTTIHGYIDLLDAVYNLGLVEALSPIQLTIRLLVPQGSRLRELDEWRKHEGEFDPSALSFTWRHTNPAVESLYLCVRELVSDMENNGMARQQIFSDVWEAAHIAAHLPTPILEFADIQTGQPYLSEGWYCCAEPTDLQLAFV